MKLSAPRVGTFLICVVLIGVGIASHFVTIPVVGNYGYYCLVGGSVLLVLSTLLKGL